GDSLADKAQVALGALGGVLDLDQPRAAGRTLSDSDDAAVSAGLKLLLPEDGDLEFAGLGLGSHDLGIGLGVEVERGSVDQVAGPVRRRGDDGPGIVGGLEGLPLGADNGQFARGLALAAVIEEA